ncbi:carbohydrate diacid regulator [Sporolactobacillus putidus]|uniref:Carbohydrate diacid regulator n=2 Tax=Sporolactobacillus putidus TaxID=492735 RepID=A0A917RXH0_9BACL|nr:carbohydrate diacid regulator [Sporolactobacillus putidus]
MIMLEAQLAQKIVGEVRLLTEESIIVMDRNGIIIASTDGERLGQLHEGARLVIERKEALIITQETAGQWRGVRAGINLPIFFQNTVVGVIGITGKPEKVANYGHLLQKMTELLIHESYYQEQLDFRERTLEGFAFDWLNNREWDDSFLSLAKILNVNLHCDRQVVFIRVPKPSGKEDGRTLAVLQELLDLEKDDILVRWGNDHLLLLADVSDQQRDLPGQVEKWAFSINKWTGEQSTIGVGSALPAEKLKYSFHQAKRALNVTGKLRPIMYDKDLTLEMISDGLDKDTKKLFIERVIGSVLSDQELLGTLRNLFAHRFSFKETADVMHIHINTLHYRLKKLQMETGLDTRDMRSRVVLYLALMFLDDQTKIT